MRDVIYSIIALIINNVREFAQQRPIAHVTFHKNFLNSGKGAYRVHMSSIIPVAFDWSSAMVASIVADMAHDRDVKYVVEYDPSSLWLTIWA